MNNHIVTNGTVTTIGNNNNEIPETEKVKELKRIEIKLKQEVDADFFQDPKQFRALPRVIDVLGAQLFDDNNANGSGGGGFNSNMYNLPSESHHQSHFDNLHKNNPAYTSLRKQQEFIEEAIEHLTVNHYHELNSSVVAVGRVSKQFGDAVGHVKELRQQVQEIRENLLNASIGGVNDGSNGVIGNTIDRSNGTEDDNENSESKSIEYYQPHHPHGGKSLRELWLKKLECEAVLALLQKLEVIRKTPNAFDSLVHSQPCRIAAAVVLLSDAIDTIFKRDVTQIQALQKVTEQLMFRKQKAEEIIWETLQDVLYLRTGNGNLLASQSHDGIGNSGTDASTQKSLNNLNLVMDGSIKSSGADSNGKRSRLSAMRGGYSTQRSKQIFVASHTSKSGEMSDSDGSDSDLETTPSISTEDRSKRSGSNANDSDKRSSIRGKRTSNRQSVNPSVLTQVDENTGGAFANFYGHEGSLLPKAMIESELDIEIDEVRCLDNWTHNHSNAAYSSFSSDATLVLPRYTDPILALRILIEALAKLGRLDDVERIIAENLQKELRHLAQLEQAKTLSKLEKERNKTGAAIHRRNVNPNTGMDSSEERLKIFKSHLRALLKSFGSVMLRLHYLAQILRHRIVSDIVVKYFLVFHPYLTF